MASENQPVELALIARVESVLPTTSGGDALHRQLYDIVLQPIEGNGVYRTFNTIRLTADERWARALTLGQQVRLLIQADAR